MLSTHSKVTLYYCWYLTGSGNQTDIVQCTLILTFVTVLSFPTDHRQRDSTVNTAAPEYLLHKHCLKAHLCFCNNSTCWRLTMWKYISIKCSLTSQTALLCLKFPRLSLLVLLVRATYIWRWVHSIREKLLTGENQNMQTKIQYQIHSVHHKTHMK